MLYLNYFCFKSNSSQYITVGLGYTMAAHGIYTVEFLLSRYNGPNLARPDQRTAVSPLASTSLVWMGKICLAGLKHSRVEECGLFP